MGFKFSDPVFPCFWLLGDLICADLCWLDAKGGFVGVFALARGASTRLETKLDLDDLHRMT